MAPIVVGNARYCDAPPPDQKLIINYVGEICVGTSSALSASGKMLTCLEREGFQVEKLKNRREMAHILIRHDIVNNKIQDVILRL